MILSSRYRFRFLHFALPFVVAAFSPLAVAQNTVSSDAIEIAFVNAVDLIWTDEGSGANTDVSFWRPTPGDGFFAVGDHAKVGYAGPQQGIMVVRGKAPNVLATPTSYQHIWSDHGSGARVDGSIWRPVCPSGFSALGDVAQSGYNPPPVQAVRCVSDSVLSGGLPGGQIWNDAGSGANSDVSIWSNRATSVSGAFDVYSRGLFTANASHAQPSVPVKAIRIPVAPTPTPTASTSLAAGVTTAQSGVPRQLLESDHLVFDFTSHFESVWADHGSGANRNVSIYKPLPHQGFHALGYLMKEGYQPPSDNELMLIVKAKNPNSGVLDAPLNYEPIWSDRGSGANLDVTIWWPQCKSGFVALGGLASAGEKPSTEEVRCIREDLTVIAGLPRAPTENNQPGPISSIWSDHGSGANRDFSAYAIQPNTAPEGQAYIAPNTFVPVASYDAGGAMSRARALKMKLKIKLASQPPAQPVLRSPSPPTEQELKQMAVTNELWLPFTAVSDPNWSMGRMALESPIYRLIRTDYYQLIENAFGYNTSSIEQSLKWELNLSKSNTESFANETGVSLTIGTGTGIGKVAKVSASIWNSFTYTNSQTQGEIVKKTVPVKIPSGTAVGAFAIQSSYQLHRWDGSLVSRVQASAKNPKSVIFLQYPAGSNTAPAVNTVLSNDTISAPAAREARTVVSVPDSTVAPSAASEASAVLPPPPPSTLASEQQQPDYYPPAVTAYMELLRDEGWDEALVQEQGAIEFEALLRIDAHFDQLHRDWQVYVDDLFAEGFAPSEIDEILMSDLPDYGN